MNKYVESEVFEFDHRKHTTSDRNYCNKKKRCNKGEMLDVDFLRDRLRWKYGM